MPRVNWRKLAVELALASNPCAKCGNEACKKAREILRGQGYRSRKDKDGVREWRRSKRT